jgi:hypothetical protein
MLTQRALLHLTDDRVKQKPLLQVIPSDLNPKRKQSLTQWDISDGEFRVPVHQVQCDYDEPLVKFSVIRISRLEVKAGIAYLLVFEVVDQFSCKIGDPELLDLPGHDVEVSFKEWPCHFFVVQCVSCRTVLTTSHNQVDEELFDLVWNCSFDPALKALSRVECSCSSCLNKFGYKSLGTPDGDFRLTSVHIECLSGPLQPFLSPGRLPELPSLAQDIREAMEILEARVSGVEAMLVKLDALSQRLSA